MDKNMLCKFTAHLFKWLKNIIKLLLLTKLGEYRIWYWLKKNGQAIKITNYDTDSMVSMTVWISSDILRAYKSSFIFWHKLNKTFIK